jgi:hypothetical protein
MIVGYEALPTAVVIKSFFWDTTPCRPAKQTFRRNMTPRYPTEVQAKQLTIMNRTTILVSCLKYTSVLKMEAICYSETSISCQRSHIAKDTKCLLKLVSQSVSTTKQDS